MLSMLVGTYNIWMVAASLLMAVLASYTALDLAGRVDAARGVMARWWLAGGSAAMGVGIWSMHFLGMLAFRLPIRMSYDPAITVLSLLIAFASSAFALWTVCRTQLSWTRLAGGSLIMGAGVSAMHYTGMAAMRMHPAIRYVPWIFTASVLIAVIASGAALWIAFHLRLASPRVVRLRAGAAVVMGIAIAGMHYTGMAAAQFPSNSICDMAASAVSAGWMALLIIVFGLAVLSIALITSVLDLRMEMRTAALSTSLATAHSELQFLALHDSLTKLPNRALLEDRLGREIQNARREKSRFSVLFLDLDGFKRINDAFGRNVGDLLLIETAGRIQSSIRGHNTLARIGADEFVLIVDAAEPADAAHVAEKLVAVLRKPLWIEGNELRVSVSIGIVLYTGREDEGSNLLKNADAAMAHAKSQGRNGYCFFESSMNEDVQKEIRLMQDLRSAVERNEFVLYYQPKFDAAGDNMIGAEALLRWNHPHRGLVSPDQFIPLVEKSGLIVPIGQWVLNEACRQLSAWRSGGFQLHNLSVNLSAVQFNHPGMIAMVSDTLERYALAPSSLTLEITESTAMQDADASISILQQLHEMGVRISIDDFGTGYSSLLYLKRLSASELKIDRGFVRDLVRNTEDAAIVAAIVALGKALNLKIVAEGVETLEQKALLHRMGCNALQGYLLGRPMPAEQFASVAMASVSEVQRRIPGLNALMPA
jgi:diguanylate cyclase